MANEWSQELLNEINSAGQAFEEAALSGNPRIPDNVRQQVAENVFYRYYQQQAAEARKRREAAGDAVASVKNMLYGISYQNGNAFADAAKQIYEQSQASVKQLKDDFADLSTKAKRDMVSQFSNVTGENQRKADAAKTALDQAVAESEKIRQDFSRAQHNARSYNSYRAVEDAHERGVSYSEQNKAYSQALEKLNKDRAALVEELDRIRHGGNYIGSNPEEQSAKQEADEKDALARLDALQKEIDNTEYMQGYARSRITSERGSEAIIRQGEELARTAREHGTEVADANRAARSFADYLPNGAAGYTNFRNLVGLLSNIPKGGGKLAEAARVIGEAVRDLPEAYNPVSLIAELGIRKGEDAQHQPQDNWTKEQVDLYNYFYGSKEYGPDVAKKYAQQLNFAINTGEVNNQTAAQYQAGVDANGSFLSKAGKTVGGLLGAIPDMALSAGDFQNKALDIIATGDYAGHRDATTHEKFSAFNRGRVEDLNRNTLSENIPVIGGKGWGDLYQLGQSSLQSLAMGNVLGEAATLGAFFVNAANSSFDEAMQRSGGNTQYASTVALLTGAAEVIGEKLSLEHLLKDGKIGSGSLSYILKQAGIEGSEEVATSLMNQFFDHVASTITGEQTAIQQQISDLVRSGMSYADAEKQVWRETVSDVAFDFVGGTLSGGFSGVSQKAVRGTQKVVQQTQNKLWEMRKQQLQNKPSKQSDKSLASMFNKALERGELETARLIQEEMKKRYPSASTAQGTQQNGETVEQGEKFAKRVLKERSTKEPEVNDAIKGLFELSNENFAGAMNGYGDQAIRDAYEWALWNDEFTKANILREIADKRGISLEKTNAQPAPQQPAEQQEERPPMPESENEAAAPEGYEGQQNERGNPFHATPEAFAKAQNLPDDVRQTLFDEFRAAQQELKNNPDLANDMAFLQRLSDLFNRANAAVNSTNTSEGQQEAPGRQEAPAGQITQPNQQNAAQTVKPGDSEQAGVTTTTAAEESLTGSTESGTMSVPNTQEVTTNAGEQTVSGEEGAGSGAGVQRDSSAEGRATDNANQSEVEQPGQLQDNREVPEGSGRDAEGAPANTVVSRGEGGTRESRVPPKWVKLQRHIDAVKSGNWFGKRHNVKAGRNALDPAYDPRGKLRPGTNVTSNFSVEIDQPDIGTVAHLMRNIMDVFGVKRNNGHIYTRAFDIVGDDGSPSGLHSKGCSSGSKVAVSVNQKGTLEQEMEGLINTAHECGHFRMQDKYGPAAAIVNVGKNGEITVGRRAEAAWQIAQDALKRVGLSEATLNSICDYWLDEHGENYKNIYINNGAYADYAKYAGDDANLLQEMLRKHVVEEFLAESVAHSPILNNAVTNVPAIESAVMQAMFEDGVLTQEQVDILQEMREAMDAKDFLPTSTDVTKAESGYYYSNVTEDQDVNDIEHNEVARRSKRSVPIEGSEKAQFQYRLDNTSESQAEKEFVSNRATKPKQNKPKNTHVETVTHSSVTDAANSILGQSLVFEGGKDSGMPDVIALDAKGTTYTVPGTVKFSIKQIKKLVKGIAVGSHPMRSIGELVDLYDSFNKSGNDMKAFTSKEIQQSIDDIKNIASSRTMSDNQKIMALENATVKTLNLISAQMNRVNMSFKNNLEFAKLMSKLPKSQKLESQKKIQSFIDKAFSWQANPTTLFKMMGGFSKTSGNIGYQFARQIQQNTIKYEMLFTEANSKYHELSKMDGYNDFARDKKMCPVKLGDMQLTEQEAIDFIKRVTTLEKTVIGGQRRIDSIKGFAVQQKDGSYKYIEKKAAKQSWIELRDQMMDSLSPVAKKYLEITGDVMHTLGQSVSETKKNITGVGFWTMDKGIYYPLQYHSPSQDTQVIDDDDDVAFFGPTGETVTQSRTRENGGYVIVRPASQTVDSYIEKASNYAAYGDLANQLYLMDNIGAGMTSLSNLVGINFGKDYARAVHNYVNDINNKKTRKPSALDSVLKKGRSYLQRGALRFSVSVPLKQAPSYWTAMGALSPDAVLKSWRMKAFMPSANYSKGDPIVAYRKIGGIDPTVSEALNNKSFISALKSKSKIIEIWDNAITSIDVKTVDNLFKATVADTVQNYPDIPRDSKLFSDIVTAKFREVVLDSQPTYVKNARSEYQRTDDETIRILSMFRTQQTQNLNNIVTAIGEFRAAKGTVREAAMTQRLKGTIAGQVASYIEFGLLSTLADFALHRKKKYKDDEDEWDAKKAATRVGLNILESAAGTLWFGDEVTKAVADAISKANKGDLNEFYGVSLGPVSTLTSVWDSFENFLSNRSVSNLQKLVSNVSQAFGVPVGNAYRAVNSAVMWSLDFMNTVDPTIGNRAGYDDITKVFDAYRKGTLEVEGAKLQATKAFKRDNTENLLYNLGILSEHGNDGENKGADWLNTRIQGKTEEERKAYKEDELARLGRNLNAGERIANYLADSALSAAQKDEAISKFATTSGYNVLYESLRAAGMTPKAAVAELGKTDNKTGMETNIRSDKSLEGLYAGEVKPGNGTDNDIPKLEKKNTDEYVNFVSAMKVFKETGNYSQLDKLVDQYSKLDANTRAVIDAKDSTMKNYLEYRAMGLSTKDYYNVKDAIKQAQIDLDLSANTGTTVKLVGLSRANLTKAQMKKLIESESLGISKTGKSLISVLEKYGYTIGEIGEFMYNTDWTNDDADGTLRQQEVVLALSKEKRLTEPQRIAIYEELKELLRNEGRINHWYDKSYEYELNYLLQNGKTSGRT